MLFFPFVFGAFAPFTIGALGCDNITGLWMNDREDEMHLHQMDDRLIGLYFSHYEGVHKQSDRQNNIEGKVGPNGLFAFTIIWAKDRRVSTCVGHCLPCSGKAMLNVTWLNRVKVDDCHDVWDATSASVETFTREPAKRLLYVTDYTVLPPGSTAAADNGCHIAGTWWDERGSKLAIVLKNMWTFQGNISAALKGGNEADTTAVQGKWNSKKPTSPYGLYAFPANTPLSQVAFIMSGQCLLCEREVVLETVWAMVIPPAKCGEGWYQVGVGGSRYKKTKYTKKRSA